MYLASWCVQSLYTDASTTYRVIVETFNKQLSLHDRISHIEVSFFTSFSFSVALLFALLSTLFFIIAVQFVIWFNDIPLLVQFELVYVKQKSNYYYYTSLTASFPGQPG